MINFIRALMSSMSISRKIRTDTPISEQGIFTCNVVIHAEESWKLVNEAGETVSFPTDAKSLKESLQQYATERLAEVKRKTKAESVALGIEDDSEVEELGDPSMLAEPDVTSLIQCWDATARSREHILKFESYGALDDMPVLVPLYQLTVEHFSELVDDWYNMGLQQYAAILGFRGELQWILADVNAVSHMSIKNIQEWINNKMEEEVQQSQQNTFDSTETKSPVDNSKVQSQQLSEELPGMTTAEKTMVWIADFAITWIGFSLLSGAFFYLMPHLKGAPANTTSPAPTNTSPAASQGQPTTTNNHQDDDIDMQ